MSRSALSLLRLGLANVRLSGSAPGTSHLPVTSGCLMLANMANPLAQVVHLLKPKRRWAQFSLGTMLVLVTLLCAVLAMIVVPAERQRRAVAAIEAVGGLVWYAGDEVGNARRSRPVQQTFLRRRLPRDYFEPVRTVDLSFCDDTDATMVHVHDLTSLQVLRLENIFTDSEVEGVGSSGFTIGFVRLKDQVRPGNQVTDAGLANLAGLTHLEEVNLDNTQITDNGLAHLRGLTSLRVLRLGRTQVTDAGLAHLQGLTCLEELRLDNTQATDAGLAYLRGLTALRALGLRATQVTDAGLVHLQELTRLEELRLDDTQVTDEGLAHIQGLQSLQLLGLSDTCVTDVGLARLQQLPRLRDIELGRSQVTDQGAARLRHALPKCNVWRRRPP